MGLQQLANQRSVVVGCGSCGDGRRGSGSYLGVDGRGARLAGRLWLRCRFVLRSGLDAFCGLRRCCYRWWLLLLW